jgi:hypothetical protein
MPDKIDLFQDNKDEYSMPSEPKIVAVRTGKYLTVSGRGGPKDEDFKRKLGALYGLAYTLKFDEKTTGGRDFKVGVLEGLWWSSDGSRGFLDTPKQTWHWKLLIRVPTFVNAARLERARARLKVKGRPTCGARLETIGEGKCLQILHVGAYADEPRSLAKLHLYAKQHGLRFHGRHHEIYLSDPRRVPGSRLRTILRHPVAPGRVRVRSARPGPERMSTGRRPDA